MLFNSYDFAVFFLIVYGIYRLLPHRAQNIHLLVSSYIFYGWWDPRFLSLILISTVVDFLCGKTINTSGISQSRKKLFLVLSICCNLGLLGFFKYYNFFIGSLAGSLSAAGFNPEVLHLNIILPVGISFYTFQTMSYTIDIYRGKLEPTENFLDFALFVAFFPQLVAGPIERATRLLPQITSPRTINNEMTRNGLSLIIWGFFKKIFVADNMAVIVNQVFSMDSSSLNFWYVTLGAYAFAFQIYGDFSGYSDIARGVSRLLGFNLKINFKSPYFVRSPGEIWRHWHVSLSTWLRDYLYISLGGNRKGESRMRINLLITMLLGGLWHGAAWNFIWWGLYHGIILIVFRKYDETNNHDTFSIRNSLKWICMFQLTAFGWLIFRAGDDGQLTIMLMKLMDIAPLSMEIIYKFGALAFFSFFVIWEQFNKLGHEHETAFAESSLKWKVPVFIYLLFSIIYLAAPAQQEFIYFQF